MRKIKIFQFPIRESKGGVTKYALNNWRYMDKNKFECHFGTCSKSLSFEDEIINLHAQVRYISCYAEQNREQFIKEVKRLFLTEKYDIIHLHTNWWKSFLVEQIAIECNISKIIVHSHNTQIDIKDDITREKEEKNHNIKKEEFNTSLATDFWACSNAAADWLFGSQIPRNKIKIMNNAIDVNKFIYNEEVRQKYRKDLGLENNFVIGHIGRMVYQKNHEFLLNMFAKVVKNQKNARLLLIGDGELKEDIINQAQKLNISDKIIMLGYRNDAAELLQAMDVFCLPSRFEGFPIVAVEAQSAGLKCILSNPITSESKITDNLELLPFNINSWVDTILNISNGYERKNMHDIITNVGFNIEKQIKEVEKLYLY